MMSLFAQVKNDGRPAGFFEDNSIWMLIGLGVLLLFGLFFVIIFFSFAEVIVILFLYIIGDQR